MCATEKSEQNKQTNKNSISQYVLQALSFIISLNSHNPM